MKNSNAQIQLGIDGIKKDLLILTFSTTKANVIAHYKDDTYSYDDYDDALYNITYDY